jgi:Calcineurin-like phosphoesterase
MLTSAFMRRVVILCAVLAGSVAAAQPPSPPPVLDIGTVRPIEPPATPLPPESATASLTRFSFLAYGDHRCSCTADSPKEDQSAHAAVVDAMVERITARAASGDPIRFVLSSGDAMFRGQDAERWGVYTPVVEKITRSAGIPYFFSVGNHDVTSMPAGDPSRAVGLHHTLTTISKLIPPEGSPRRLSGYPTYTFGYGNAFFIAFDSNIAADPIQLAWVTQQLEGLDRTRYRNIFAFFHHPAFSGGPHNGAQPRTPEGEKPPDRVEPPTVAIRTLYAPLFRKHHVRMTITGHDHLFDHWVEHYVDGGKTYRRDDVVTGGGGAPIYVYAGEPDLQAYLAGGADQQVRVEHLAKPGSRIIDNPHHFVMISVDGEKLSLEVVAVGGPLAPYNGRSRTDLNE